MKIKLLSLKFLAVSVTVIGVVFVLPKIVQASLEYYQYPSNNMSAADIRITGTSNDGRFGVKIARIGDLTGDNLPDLAVTSIPGFAVPIYDQPYAFSVPVTAKSSIYIFSGAYIATHSNFSSTNAYRVIQAANNNDFAGYEVASINDLDNDNKAELVISAPHATGICFPPGSPPQKICPKNGATYIMLSSTILSRSTLTLNDAAVVFWGQQQMNFSGSAIAVDNIDNQSGKNGLEDLVISAPYYDNSAVEGEANMGRVYIIKGSTLVSLVNSSSQSTIHRSLGTADIKITGSNQSHFGFSVTTIADFSGDKKSELAIGAPYYNRFTLPNYVAPRYAGAVALFSSEQLSQYNNLQSGDAEIFIEANSETAGIYPADTYPIDVKLGWKLGNGDINGDGLGDLIISSRGWMCTTTCNRIKIYLGNRLASLLGSSSSNHHFANSIANYTGTYSNNIRSIATGDFDNDGKDNLLLGTDADGMAYMMTSNTLGKSPLLNLTRYFAVDSTVFEFHSEGSFYNDWHWLGYDIDSMGDINNDGFDDMVMGASGYDGSTPGSNLGRVYVVFGGICQSPNCSWPVDPYDPYAPAP